MGEKLANRELFAKIFLSNIHRMRYIENVLGLCTILAYSPNFSSPIAFTCMVLPHVQYVVTIYDVTGSCDPFMTQECSSDDVSVCLKCAQLVSEVFTNLIFYYFAIYFTVL